jgi:cell division protein FtsQ
MQRLWLTPGVRPAVRLGLPLCVVAAVAALVLASAPRREALITTFADLRDAFENRPEFRVSQMRIEGAAPELADAVRGQLALRLPMSSFDLDLDAIQARIEALDAVAHAKVMVRSGELLQVTITERVPVLVWRGPQGLALVDAQGYRVAGLAARADRADLPLIAGPAAGAAAAEALAVYEAAAPLAPRLRGLVRVGERRWDLVLDRDQRILLPQADPVQALGALLGLDAVEDILARDITVIDLRFAARPTLRLTQAAWDRKRGIEPEPTTSTESDL